MTDDPSLLRELGAAAQAHDPVPAWVSELGRAAFGLRRLDAELAELVADSEVELAGVRSAGSDVRLLTFEAGDLVVEAQVTGTGDRRTLLGQVLLVSAPEGPIRLETTDSGSTTLPLDELGGFRFDAVRPGLVRLSIQLGEGRAVSTTWFSV
jgi:hypothetical protein